MVAEHFMHSENKWQILSISLLAGFLIAATNMKGYRTKTHDHSATKLGSHRCEERDDWWRRIGAGHNARCTIVFLDDSRISKKARRIKKYEGFF